ncbi:MAG: S49 family peptidase [bacterium]|nr:MAG: S49 family peptidase [bacterium]
MNPAKGTVSVISVAIVLTLLACTARLSGAEPEPPCNRMLRSDLYTHRFVADTDDATSLFVNPAGLAMRWNTHSIVRGTYLFDHVTELTSAFSMPFLGFGFMYQDTDLFKSRSYLLGIAVPLGRRHQFTIGTSLQWHHTDLPFEDRSPFTLDVGCIMRPHRYLSIGAVWQNANHPRFARDAQLPAILPGYRNGRLEETFTGGISIRPFTERITLSGQGGFAENTKPEWLIGGRLEVIPGLSLFGSYARDYSYGLDDPYEEFTGGIAFSFESFTAITSTRSQVDGDYDYSRNTFALERTHSFKKNALFHPKRFAEVDVSGNYLDEGGGFVIMGERSKNLHRLLRDLENIRRDDDVEGLLLHVGTIEDAFIGPVTGNLYEIRRAVTRVREAGKPVVAYIKDFGGPGELYLASSANRIVIPRETIVGLIGVSLEINRLKRLFAKLGIDWDSYTAGEYKSSFHTPYTDTTTALQAKEIRALVEEAYRIIVETIAEGRGIEKQRMYGLADGRPFSTEEAVELGLVDVIGWEKKAKEELGKLAGLSKPDRLETVSISGRRYWMFRSRLELFHHRLGAHRAAAA